MKDLYLFISVLAYQHSCKRSFLYSIFQKCLFWDFSLGLQVACILQNCSEGPVYIVVCWITTIILSCHPEMTTWLLKSQNLVVLPTYVKLWCEFVVTFDFNVERSADCCRIDVWLFASIRCCEGCKFCKVVHASITAVVLSVQSYLCSGRGTQAETWNNFCHLACTVKSRIQVWILPGFCFLGRSVCNHDNLCTRKDGV